MNFVLYYTLDLSTGFDLTALIGTIELRDDKSGIHEHVTYLDSWFAALQVGLTKLTENQKEIVLDLIDEPKPVRFSMQSGKLSISYKDITVSVESLPIYEKVLSETMARFVAEIELFTATPYQLPVERILELEANHDLQNGNRSRS